MTRLLDKLNLRPQERRLVIFVAVVVFVALNWFFVRPYFGELGRTQKRLAQAEKDMKTFKDEIQKKSIYQGHVDELSRQGGQVATVDQAMSLIREVNNQAANAGVNIQSLNPAPSSHDVRTNATFDEQGATLSFANTGENELINFLYTLASQKSLIRVKSMILRPDTGGMKLGGTLTLVESFQKKQPAKAATPAPAAAASSKPSPAKPATNAAPKTAAPPAAPPALKPKEPKKVQPPPAPK